MPESAPGLDELAALWTVRDPMPSRLVEQVLVSIATEDVDLDYELLHLVERSRKPTGVRASTDALTIAFAAGTFSLLVRVSVLGQDRRRVDGWVTPARPMRVTALQRSKSWEAAVDPVGRFELPALPAGLTRLRFAPAGAAAEVDPAAAFATPTFEL